MNKERNYTPEDLQKKIYDLIENLDKLVPLWSKSKADKNFADEMKKVTLNVCKSASDEKSGNKREEVAYASKEYKEYLWKAFKVDCEFYEFDARKSKIEKELDAFRSLLSFEKNQINRTT